MNQTKLILIAGFGNLGAKLLPLRWAFPHLRFFVVEKYWPSFQAMRTIFSNAGTLGDLLRQDVNAEFAHDNLKAFRGELERIPGAPKELLLREYGSQRLRDLFDRHVCYCGGPEFERGDKVERIPRPSSRERAKRIALWSGNWSNSSRRKCCSTWRRGPKTTSGTWSAMPPFADEPRSTSR